MNNVVLIGRLTHEPELRFTNSNKAVLNSSIAVQRNFTNQDGEKEVDFINIQVWGKQAENLQKYCSKGSKIAILGQLRVDYFDKSDGTKGYKVYVLANNVQFLDTKKEKSNSEIVQEAIKSETDIYADFGEQVTIDDDFLD